jgi:hypothetical protein
MTEAQPIKQVLRHEGNKEAAGDTVMKCGASHAQAPAHLASPAMHRGGSRQTAWVSCNHSHLFAQAQTIEQVLQN